MIAVLTATQIKYVVTGTVAYGFYAPPRAITSIALLVPEGERRSARRALAISGSYQSCQPQFRDQDKDIEFYLRLATVDPELSGLEDPARHEFADVPILVIKPEHLLWMYCLSDLSRHFAEAIELVKAGQVDIGGCYAFCVARATERHKVNCGAFSNARSVNGRPPTVAP
jgi:hypothetical protein